MGFSTVDVRGYSVECSDYYWKTHVLTRHPSLAEHEADAKRAIEKRDFIYVSKTNPDRHIYYGPLTGRRPEIKVVVDFDKDHRGTVVSVSEVSNRPRGEKTIWPEAK